MESWSDDPSSRDNLEEDPSEFVNRMLVHRFGIAPPNYIVTFSSKRTCHDPFAIPLNLCIGSYEDDGSDVGEK